MDKIDAKFAAFDWDEGNRNKSLTKHGVSCAEAEEAYYGWHFVFRDLVHSTAQEERFVLLGETRAERRLMIVFTIRLGRVRVISARPMNQKERMRYETEKEKGVH